MEYIDKLKDPRWQKKRLEVMEKANWECKMCRETKRTLHVHHLKYEGEPWDASQDDLICLCDLCHECLHNNISYEELCFIFNPKHKKIFTLILDEIIETFPLVVDRWKALRCSVKGIKGCNGG